MLVDLFGKREFAGRLQLKWNSRLRKRVPLSLSMTPVELMPSDPASSCARLMMLQPRMLWMMRCVTGKALGEALTCAERLKCLSLRFVVMAKVPTIELGLNRLAIVWPWCVLGCLEFCVPGPHDG